MDNCMKCFSEIFSTEVHDQPALYYQGRRYSYGELGHAVAICAAKLYQDGLRPGDHAAIWAQNSDRG